MTRAVAVVAAVVLTATPAAAHAAIPIRSTAFLPHTPNASPTHHGRAVTASKRITVKAGDTLSSLFADTPGGPYRAAYVNDLDNPDLIEVGQILTIPVRDGKRYVPPRPTAAVSRSVGTVAPSVNETAGSVGSSVWTALADCESGGDWTINTGNGYFGGLQFSLSSWQAVGGSGYPHQHSAATQIAMGQRLQAAQGWGAWPGCAAELGLL